MRSSVAHNTDAWKGIRSGDANMGVRSRYGNLTGGNHKADFNMISYPHKVDKVFEDDGNSTENILQRDEATIVRTTEVEVMYNLFIHGG